MGLLRRSIALAFYKIYWEQFCLPINYLLFHLKFTVFKVHRRSKQSLIKPTRKPIDTNEQMAILEIGRDNMTEFVKKVPDECLIDLSERCYCGKRR